MHDKYIIELSLRRAGEEDVLATKKIRLDMGDMGAGEYMARLRVMELFRDAQWFSSKGTLKPDYPAGGNYWKC